MNKINKHELLWIFALKDNRVEEFYKEHYGDYENEPSDATLFSILSQLIDKIGEWEYVMKLLRIELTTKRILNSMNGEKEPNLEGWIVYGIKYWALMLTRDDLDELWGSNSWEPIVDQERHLWKMQDLKAASIKEIEEEIENIKKETGYVFEMLSQSKSFEEKTDYEAQLGRLEIEYLICLGLLNGVSDEDQVAAWKIKMGRKIEKIKDIAFAVTHPKHWVRLYKTDKGLDRWFETYLANGFEFEPVFLFGDKPDNCYVKFANEIFWIANKPYACFDVGDEMPSRRMVNRLLKLLEKNMKDWKNIKERD
jgi:hypothetical protein